MFQDPIVYQRLQKHGFDVWANYQSGTKEALMLLEKATPPKNHETTVLWISNYIGNILEWEIARSERSDIQGNSFQLRFDKLYPQIAIQGRSLLNFIQSIGYDSLSKIDFLLRGIIVRYNLGEWVMVRNYDVTE